MPIGTPYKSSKSRRTRRDHARDTEGLEAISTARLITPEVKSGCFEIKQRNHLKICPVAGAYAAPKQKASADGADMFAKESALGAWGVLAPQAHCGTLRIFEPGGVRTCCSRGARPVMS